MKQFSVDGYSAAQKGDNNNTKGRIMFFFYFSHRLPKSFIFKLHAVGRNDIFDTASRCRRTADFSNLVSARKF